MTYLEFHLIFNLPLLLLFFLPAGEVLFFFIATLLVSQSIAMLMPAGYRNT